VLKCEKKENSTKGKKIGSECKRTTTLKESKNEVQQISLLSLTGTELQHVWMLLISSSFLYVYRKSFVGSKPLVSSVLRQ